MVAGDFEVPANGRLAANEYTGSSNVKFLGYRLLKIPFCEADYQIDIYTGTASEAYFFEEFNEDGRCGYRLVEGAYNFQPTGDGSLIGSVIPVSGDIIETWTRKPGSCPEGTGWITGADGIKRKTIAHAGSRFYLEDSNGNITVKGEWKGFGKCLACKAVAEQALQNALSKARSGNGGKLAEKTVVIPATEKGYGPADSVFYTQMRLEDIIKNLAETYNSLLENVKVPTAAWRPGGKFYVRDETAVISGAIYQGLEELRDIPELVGLGLAFVSDPDGAYGQLQTFAQQMSWEKAKGIGVEVARGAVFADEFEKGGKFALHGTGRAGVVIAKAVVAGGLLAVVKGAPGALKKKIDDALAYLGQLRQEVRDVLNNFSDETLTRFASELADQEFFNWVNDANNEKFVRGFVNHKLFDADIQDIGGLLAELENLNDLPPQVKKWLENSKSSARFKYFRDLGVSLNKNIKSALRNQFTAKSGPLFDGLKTQLGMTADELSLYEILDEIPLNTSGGFMKADVLLLKRNILDPTKIDDAIIIENKLSLGTALTTRQKEGFGAIIGGQTNMKTTYATNSLGVNIDIPVSNQKIFKLYDHGSDNISNVDILKITSIN